jgi:hypothetical protein
MTDDEKDELISDAGEITHQLVAVVTTGSPDMLKALFAFLQVAVKAQEWEMKRARFVDRARKEQQP